MLFKAIEHGKEHRKPYSTRSMRRYRLWSMCCVRHNPRYCQCERCRDNRLYKYRKSEVKSFFNIEEEGFYIRSSFRIKAV